LRAVYGKWTWLAGRWLDVDGGVLNITAAVWTAGFQWWRSGNITQTQNVREYMLVLAVCLVFDYKALTKHTTSTSMYSLTFRVHVATPPQCRRNGTSHAAGASILSPARGVFAGTCSVRVRHACGLADYRWALSHFHSVAIVTQPVH